jgi:ATP-binding cassette, subfamily F, member 3
MGQALGDFNGTVMVVSHDRTFVNLLANEIWEVKDGTVKIVLGTYEDYVWAKEQEVENESQSSSKPQAAKSTKTLDKEQRVRLYNLNKDLDKAKKKITSLESKLADNPSDSKIKTDIEEAEFKWLTITKEIEELEN